MIFKTTVDSPGGTLRLFASDAGLCAVLWPQSDYKLKRAVDPVDSADHPVLVRAVRQLGEYFASGRREFDVPLDPVGTPFQLRAWAQLREIPYGTTLTYGEQAAAIGRPTAARAVGGANGRNPLSILVPCHRVIGADGSLTGFGGGLETKRFLLALEAQHTRLNAGSENAVTRHENAEEASLSVAEPSKNKRPLRAARTTRHNI